jgi:hypothetical protein
MAIKNRYGKRKIIIDELMSLGYHLEKSKPTPKRTTYKVTKDKLSYEMEFTQDWLSINKHEERLYCGINLSTGKALARCVDNNLIKLFNDVKTIAYKRTNIKTPTLIN